MTLYLEANMSGFIWCQLIWRRRGAMKCTWLPS